MTIGERAVRSRPDPKCPVRTGDSCGLCFPGATGPHDCGLVQLVMTDPDLRAELAGMRSGRVASGND